MNEGDTPGTVNDADYTFWRSRFGATSGSGAALNTAVPEPAGAALVIAAIGIQLAAASATRQRPK
jgi:hypothetical protein